MAERNEKGQFTKGFEEDLTGRKFEMLTVIGFDGEVNGRYFWKCRCNCGKIKSLDTNRLKNTKSCGCLHHPYGKEINRNDRLYVLLMGIRQRCNNPNHVSYEHYGGRGIRVCTEWENDFMAFREWALDNGYNYDLPRGVQTLDRIDVDKDYSPDNCRWVTIKEQQRNKRNTRLFEYNGEFNTVGKWAEILGFDCNLLRSRVFQYGMTIKEAIETPLYMRHSDKYAYVDYKGERKSILKISKETGIDHGVLLGRYRNGENIEEVVKWYEENGGYAKRYEYEGKKLTVAEWSKEIGVPEPTLQYRIRVGKPLEQVFTKKKYKRK